MPFTGLKTLIYAYLRPLVQSAFDKRDSTFASEPIGFHRLGTLRNIALVYEKSKNKTEKVRTFDITV